MTPAARSPVARDTSVDQAPKTGNPSSLEGGRQDKSRAARLIFFLKKYLTNKNFFVILLLQGKLKGRGIPPKRNPI